MKVYPFLKRPSLFSQTLPFCRKNINHYSFLRKLTKLKNYPTPFPPFINFFPDTFKKSVKWVCYIAWWHGFVGGMNQTLAWVAWVARTKTLVWMLWVHKIFTLVEVLVWFKKQTAKILMSFYLIIFHRNRCVF